MPSEPASFSAVRREHDASFRPGVRERPREGRQEDVGADEELLQHRLGPGGVELGFEQRERAEKQRIIGHRGKELRDEGGGKPARP